jgi:hypothetical protein
MITAKVVKESEIDRGTYLTQEVEFETVSQLESYLSYNRANIVELELSGKLGA